MAGGGEEQADSRDIEEVKWRDLVTSLRWDPGKGKRRQGSRLAFDWGRRVGWLRGH